jgi:hypothetical protein
MDQIIHEKSKLTSSVRWGVRTLAYRSRMAPEATALDRSAKRTRADQTDFDDQLMLDFKNDNLYTFKSVG